MKLYTIGYWGAFPQANEATSCYLIEEGETKVVLDCGSGALSKLQNQIQLEELDAVFISHLHTDHMADIFSLEYACLVHMQLGKRKKPLEVYIYGDSIDGLPFEFPDVMHVHPIDITKEIKVGPLCMTFSENVHDIPCCAIKVTNQNGSQLVYSADTGYTTTLIDFAKGANTLLIECSFYGHQKGIVNGHLSSYETAAIAKEAGVENIILTHFPHFGDLNQLKEEVSSVCKEQMVYLAKNGFIIYL